MQTEMQPWWHSFLSFSQDDVGWPLYLMCCVCAGIAGGVAVGGVLASLEIAWYFTLRTLERKGLIKRLAPSVQVAPAMTSYKKEAFLAVAIAPMPLAAIVFLGRKKYVENMYFALDFVGAARFCWIVMALHDAYFWAVHTLLHRVKYLYSGVHHSHHSMGGGITVFSTAYGEVLDIALCITPFYALFMAWVYTLRCWNAFHMGCLVWAVNGVNVMGHCGYRLPLWVYAPGSFGMLVTPWAQRPLHHLIHHLDPRFNRALYFTWCDRLSGTFRGSHPKIHS